MNLTLDPDMQGKHPSGHPRHQTINAKTVVSRRAGETRQVCSAQEAGRFHPPCKNWCFTVRELMAAVAIVAVPLGITVELKERQERFGRLSQQHLGQIIHAPDITTSQGRRLADRNVWHFELGRKYGRAANSPWFPVPPDAPEPE